MFLSINIRSVYLQSEKISIEPLIEHIKSVFRIDPLSVLGFHTVSAIILFVCFIISAMVYYNCKTEKINPIQNQ